MFRKENPDLSVATDLILCSRCNILNTPPQTGIDLARALFRKLA
jgi:hypothetical protein